MSARPRITIDANCIINLFDTSSPSATSVEPLTALISRAMDAKVEIAVTTRVESDLLKDRDEERRKSLLRSLSLFPVISTLGKWDVSKWDSDVWTDERTARLSEEIQQILSPGLTQDDPRYGNKINDVDHLVGHAIDRRDIFVTDDRGILRRREQLQRGLGIVVMTPVDCVEHIEGIASRERPRILPSEGIDPAYHSAALSGTVSFDYSNNNHIYAIGEDEALFETLWSKASNVSIYALRDAPSIDALALAKSVSEIRDISDAAAFDFSSRHRTPKLGEIVVWRNINGLYAATKVTGIQDDSRGAAHDELVYDFVILPDGSADFSKVA